MAVAKYFANREKDRRYTTDLWRHGMLDAATIRERMRNAPITKAKRKAMLAAVSQDQTAARHTPGAARSKLTELADKAFETAQDISHHHAIGYDRGTKSPTRD